MTRRRDPLPFTVTGPEYEHVCTSYGSAVALALDRASREGVTHYIREYGDVIARAEGREGGGSVLVEL